MHRATHDTIVLPTGLINDTWVVRIKTREQGVASETPPVRLKHCDLGSRKGGGGALLLLAAVQRDRPRARLLCAERSPVDCDRSLPLTPDPSQLRVLAAFECGGHTRRFEQGGGWRRSESVADSGCRAR